MATTPRDRLARFLAGQPAATTDSASVQLPANVLELSTDGIGRVPLPLLPGAGESAQGTASAACAPGSAREPTPRGSLMIQNPLIDSQRRRQPLANRSVDVWRSDPRQGDRNPSQYQRSLSCRSPFPVPTACGHAASPRGDATPRQGRASLWHAPAGSAQAATNLIPFAQTDE
jgi:hypothetical protein